MVQTMKIDRRLDPPRAAGRRERALLLGFAPRLAITAEQQARAAGFPRGKPAHEISALLSQHDVARLPALAGAHSYGA